MKKLARLLVLATPLLATASFAEGPVPLCLPDNPCVALAEGPVPLCLPDKPCVASEVQ